MTIDFCRITIIWWTQITGQVTSTEEFKFHESHGKSVGQAKLSSTNSMWPITEKVCFVYLVITLITDNWVLYSVVSFSCWANLNEICRSQKLVKNEDNISHKLVKDDEKSSRNSSMNGTQATKRQKLEAGFSRKVQ